MIRSPRGTQDITPADWPRWNHVLSAAISAAELAGFDRIETPMFEETALFTHATGEHTDVNREMYTFEDRGGDNLSLRPEGTASVFRAYAQHGMHVLPQPVKLYYLGSMFRYERPQAGRFREHHQFGCEAIGSADPLMDATMISVQDDFYSHAGLPPSSIHLNSIGDSRCRPEYLVQLVGYLRSNQSALCSQCRDRIERNPLRVLDCKVESCQPILNAAPRLLDHLCDECRQHWDRFLDAMGSLGLAYEIDGRLVRGLDYYTRTVWEFLPQEIKGATSTIGGGGRYDDLSTVLGFRPTPAVGFSTGLERVLINMPDDLGTSDDAGLDVYGVTMGEEAALRMIKILAGLRRSGFSTDMGLDGRSLKAQLKQANARRARLAIIIGQDELAAGQATCRDLGSGDQSHVAIDELDDYVEGVLSEDV
jgi:histidyl-tRNA synthetase